MWVFARYGFISAITHKDKPGSLLVQGRCLEHLRALFPGGTEVTQVANADYKYQVTVSVDNFKSAMLRQIEAITYNDFRNAIPDHKYHDACNTVWRVMHRLQPGSYMPPCPEHLLSDAPEENHKSLQLADNDANSWATPGTASAQGLVLMLDHPYGGIRMAPHLFDVEGGGIAFVDDGWTINDSSHTVHYLEGKVSMTADGWTVITSEKKMVPIWIMEDRPRQEGDREKARQILEQSLRIKIPNN